MQVTFTFVFVTLAFLSKSDAFVSICISKSYLLENTWQLDAQGLQELDVFESNNNAGDQSDTKNGAGQNLMQQYFVKTPSPYDSIWKPAPLADELIDMAWFDNVKSSFLPTTDKSSPIETNILQENTWKALKIPPLLQLCNKNIISKTLY